MYKFIFVYLLFGFWAPLQAQSSIQDIILEYNKITSLSNSTEQLHALNLFLQKYPDFAKAYVFRGKCYRQKRQFEDALRDCDTAYQINATLQDIFEERGRIYLDMKNYVAAISDFETSIRLQPCAETYNMLGFIYEEMTVYEKSIQQYETALKMKPNLMEAQQNLKRVRSKQLITHNEIVRIAPQSILTTTKEDCLEIIFALKHGTVKSFKCLVNGQQAIFCTRGQGIRNKATETINIRLAIGQNTIEIETTDERNQILRHRFSVERVDTQQRVALLIGNMQYPIRPLANPVNDIDSMSKVLTQKHFVVTPAKNLHNQLELEQTIDAFITKNKEKSVLLFFFAGHGEEINELPHLLGLDEEGKNGFNLQSLFDKFKKIQTNDNKKLFIVIIDACRSKAVRKASKELESLMPHNMIVGFGTFSGQDAADDCGQNGCYTQSFLEALRMPQPDLNAVFNKTRELVRKYTQDKQQSVEKNTLEAVHFIF